MSRAAADASVFAAIADPTRRGILDLLREGERCVAELLEPFRMTAPALSQHLAVLRRAGLVAVRKAGRMRVYRIEPGPLHEVSSWIAQYERFWNAKLENLGRYLDAQAQRPPAEAGSPRAAHVGPRQPHAPAPRGDMARNKSQAKEKRR